MDLSLDDIIARNKAAKRGGGTRGGRGAARTNGRANGGGFNAPRQSGTFRQPAPSNLAKEINAHKRVRINISNLAPSVRTGDLEELFANYGLESAAVNYGEVGQHLGTGDIILTKRDAHRVLNDFHGVTVDGQRLTMILVEDGSLDSGSIFNRVKLAGGGGGVQRSRPAPRAQSQQQRRGGFSGGAQRGRGGRGGKTEKKPRTVDDLDAELDAYMKKP
ncbi:aly-1 [Pristionchus pacificus]|nr:aly-1 [Pristionchus pacificus]